MNIRALRLTATLLLAVGISVIPARAYRLTTPFQTEHFAVNQVILDQGETLNDLTARVISGDPQTRCATTGRLQVTTVLFPPGSRGFAGTAREPTAGFLNVTRYDGGEEQATFSTKPGYAAEAGLRVSQRFLEQVVDLQPINALLGEIVRFPLVISDLEVSLSNRDPKEPSGRQLYFTTRTKALIVDFHVIDNLFLKPEELQGIKRGCKIDVMGFADRAVVDGAPLFMAMHGLVNRCRCE